MAKVIMLIPPTELPIPAVGGGAIETLITNLLEVNEKQKKAEFVVISKYDSEVINIKYLHSKIFYFKDGVFIGRTERLLRFLWFLYRIWFKLFQNHFIGRFFKTNATKMNYFAFQCSWIAKVNHVDTVVLEGRWDEKQWKSMNRFLGENAMFTHIHCERNEDLSARSAIHNSISISNYVQRKWAVSQEIDGRNNVLYNGIDIEKFYCPLSIEERASIRCQYGVAPQELLVLFCGRLIKEKGIKELLDAFELIKDEPIKLMLIGSVGFSSNTTSEYAEYVTKRASSMKNVIPMGYVPNDTMPKFYAISDVQVIPSIWEEGAGLVAVEGMASGLPLIITESGGMVEYVSDDTAIQIKRDDNLSANIAKAILRLAENEELRVTMGRSGQERARIFSKENYYTNFLDIVLKEIGER